MSKCNNCYHNKVCIDSANYKNAENCRQYVSEKDVQEVRHWISVKDRLPNPEERVLVFVKALGKIDNIHKDVITTNWITSSGNWIDNWKGIGNYIITHWMPLPDPPSTTDGGDTNT